MKCQKIDVFQYFSISFLQYFVSELCSTSKFVLEYAIIAFLRKDHDQLKV